MKTKVCKKCKRELCKKNFGIDRKNDDNLFVWCNECKYNYYIPLKQDKKLKKQPFGGIVITILNYAKKGEFKYSIKGNGLDFESNDKEEYEEIRKQIE